SVGESCAGATLEGYRQSALQRGFSAYVGHFEQGDGAGARGVHDSEGGGGPYCRRAAREAVRSPVCLAAKFLCSQAVIHCAAQRVQAASQGGFRRGAVYASVPGATGL